MATLLVLLLAFFAHTRAADLRDVPLGECHGCEVTCLEDCSLKYYREIMSDDFLQVDEPAKKVPKNRTSNLTNIGKQYAECLKEDKCPCPKEDAKAAAARSTGEKALLQMKNTSCSLTQNSCAMECSTKVVSNAHAKLEAKKKAQSAKKKTALMFLEKSYPIHSVQVGVFSKGHMNLAECHKFCLAATCGCVARIQGKAGIDKLFKAIKANDAAEPGEKDFSHRGDVNNEHGGGVVDTHASYQFRPAKIEECAKGIIGKKVSKGLWIDFGFGLRGEREICSDDMLEKVFGPGDHKKKEKLCGSRKSDDAKWGCIWNEKKGYCGVGFSPNLRCQIKFIRDPSRL